jgi:hypothetical protein
MLAFTLFFYCARQWTRAAMTVQVSMLKANACTTTLPYGYVLTILHSTHEHWH